MFMLFTLTALEVEYCFLGNNRFPPRPATEYYTQRNKKPIDLRIKTNAESIHISF